MAVRRGYGDETWRMAREGDRAGLQRAADLLLQDADLNYEGHRARAFAFAVEGRRDDALEQLHEGWTEEWPFPAAYATDVARVRFLAGDYDEALTALHLAVRSSEQLDDAVAALATDCVRRSRRTFRKALGVALAGGSSTQKAGAALAVIRARF